jgi:hypothetical protein
MSRIRHLASQLPGVKAGLEKLYSQGDKQWGVGDMRHDLTDSVKWAIEQEFADEIASFAFTEVLGGYACLAGLALRPTFTNARRGHCWTFNIKTLLDGIPAYWALYDGMLLKVSDVDRIEVIRRSPFYPCRQD